MFVDQFVRCRRLVRRNQEGQEVLGDQGYQEFLLFLGGFVYYFGYFFYSWQDLGYLKYIKDGICEMMGDDDDKIFLVDLGFLVIKSEGDFSIFNLYFRRQS